MKKPCKDCRPITGAICFASSPVMRNLNFAPVTLCRSRRFQNQIKRLWQGKHRHGQCDEPKPDCKSINPMVKRGALNCAVSPTVAMINPRTVINNALDTCPVPAKAAMAERPTIISAKYSAEWNSNATDDSMGAKIINRMAPIVPPRKRRLRQSSMPCPPYPDAPWDNHQSWSRRCPQHRCVQQDRGCRTAKNRPIIDPRQ